MPNANVGEIVATTLRARSGILADNVTKNNALWFRLNEKGNVKPFNGGRTIFEELSYAENSSYKRYSGLDLLNINPSNVLDAAEFDIKQVAIAVVISGLELLQNAGEEQFIDLLEGRIDNAEASMRNGMTQDAYSDGTADGGKQIGGLQLLVADSPGSATIGGIAQASFPFWKNFSFDATTDGLAAATTANIQDYMTRVYLTVSRGNDQPDLIIADNNYWRLYNGSLQPRQLISNSKMADAGFQNLKFMGADVVFDGGVGGFCPTNHMYFLNTNYLRLRPHAKQNMEPLAGGTRVPVQQDAEIRLVGWAGNMTARGLQYQGLLKD